jgi:zinc transport system ATP-binding protein
VKAPLIQVQNLGFAYSDGEQILKNVSFSLNASEILGVIGPNGGGKSTLLKLVIGLLTPESGSIEKSSSRLAYLPQSRSMNDTLPVTIDNVLDMIPAHSNPLGKSEALKTVGMTRPLTALFRTLSGGEKQRVLLARALRQHPEILILDEPTQGLDGQGQDQLLSLLQSLKKDFACGIIVVDHNLAQIVSHADKILCVNRTHHWHDSKELFNGKILNSIYHCEFEHMLIHHDSGAGEHHHCADHDHHHHDDDKGRS